jgi:hypothetical protein
MINFPYFFTGFAKIDASKAGFISMDDVSTTIFPPPMGLGVSIVKGKNNPSMAL